MPAPYEFDLESTKYANRPEEMRFSSSVTLPAMLIDMFAQFVRTEMLGEKVSGVTNCSPPFLKHLIVGPTAYHFK